MKTYKFDTHVHTSETSICGKVNAFELVSLYKNTGYDGIVITDHYYKDFFDKLGNISWEEKVDIYLQGYRNAAAEGERAGLDVILGMELRFTEHYNDYLVFGIDEAFLRENTELYNLGLKEFRKLIKDKNILIVQAHPFRSTATAAAPELLHGVEVINGNPRHDSQNHLAYEYARKHGLKMLSGSDFHQVQDLGQGGIVLSEPVFSSSELVDIIKEDKIIKIIGL